MNNTHYVRTVNGALYNTGLVSLGSAISLAGDVAEGLLKKEGTSLEICHTEDILCLKVHDGKQVTCLRVYQ